MVPDGMNPQAFNWYVYTLNNPVKYTDPSGHRETDGCDTEGCSATQWDMDRAIGNAERAKSTKFYRDCANGGGPECNTLHDAEDILKGMGLAFGGMVAAPFAAAVGSLLCSVGARCVTGAINSVANFFGSLAGQAATGKVDILDAASAAGAGFFSRYVMPTGPGSAALTYGLAGGAQQIASDVLHGRDVSPGLVMLNSSLSAGLGVRFGVYTPNMRLLQTSVPEIYKAGQGSMTAAASISFKNVINAWRYVPNAMTLGNFVRSMATSAVSNGIPNLFVNTNP